MSRVRLVAAGGFIAVLAAALVVVLVRGSQTSAERRPSAQLSPSPTPSVEVASVPEGDYPTPANTGEATSEDDFERIFREIAAFRTWLYRNPHPELASLIYDPGCDCYDLFTTQLQALSGHDARYDDAGTQVHSIAVAHRVDDYMVLLEVVTSHGMQRVVDSEGQVVETGVGWETRQEMYTLVRGADGRWRVVHVALGGPAEENSAR
ncbi:MAG: hypothetical protein KY462_04030 [Actinobacteria bacterium]|nr:hypothetical protein [Actinomycetota bacterium]